MERSVRHIAIDRQGDVFCVRFRSHHMSEADILETADELLGLISKDGCRKMVLSLGPGEIECLYSVFLAKLVMVRRHLAEGNGRLKIAEASNATIGVFEACRLREYFEFEPDVPTAVAHFSS
jgi:hypothetical protein